MLEMIIVPIVTYLKMMKIANNNLIGRLSAKLGEKVNELTLWQMRLRLRAF